eukprot:CAMPEP_0197881176 /NCGR_PEP_ID=MMETSP1439-20131203/8747_1 /TAXON_ID=66791 /ORGANISM="Gonyaulax spinifera, Strain CCMP409" /LENGTH=57 /DNA_ID=CAMNT_0043500765 /DNA_START=14 /DNA_END=182 /DNA_ORIENTATION=-
MMAGFQPSSSAMVLSTVAHGLAALGCQHKLHHVFVAARPRGDLALDGHPAAAAALVL